MKNLALKNLRELLINYLMTTSTNPYWEKKNPTIIKNTDQALSDISALLPKEMNNMNKPSWYLAQEKGYNECLKDVRKRLGI